MRKMKYIVLLGLILSLSACNKWLDVEPLGQVDAEKMFEDEKGCLQTLTGTYILLTSQEAYGEELTLGYVDEIVRYWNKIGKAYDFDYKDATLVGRFNGTWGKMYEAIANVNLLLQNLKDSDKGKFENYDLVILDELGYVSFDKEGCEILFNLLSNRNDKGSIIITTNLTFDRWEEIFKDAMLTGAMVDRLAYKAHILDLSREVSHRYEETVSWKKEKN